MKRPFFYSKHAIIVILIIILIVLSFYTYNAYSKLAPLKNQISLLESQNNDLQEQINSLNEQKDALENQIDDLNYQIQQKDIEIEEQKREINSLKNKIKQLEIELATTKAQLEEMTVKYEEAQPYQERVDRGQTLSQSYTLLADYEDYAKPIILSYLGLSYPTAPSNDNELWERGRKIYNWLSDNYEYCGDKGLRVGTTFYQFQFYSPDELLMSDNTRCGDCDDFATLFAGLMYASGVSENKVWVVCGSVPGGGHCWNWLSLSDQTYRIDGVCSQEQELFGFLGLNWGLQGAYYTSTQKNVDCFSEYDAQIKMNPNSYSTIS